MRFDSLKNQLYQKFQNRYRSGENEGFMSLTEAQDYGRALGFSADNGGRRVRDLYADGVLEKRPKWVENKKVWVMEYRWLDPFAVKQKELVTSSLC